MTSKKPHNIKLTHNMVNELKTKVNSTALENSDKEILTGLIESNLWLQAKLKNSTITIAQLKKLFGVNITTEKKSLELTKQKMAQLIQQLAQQAQ